MKFFEMIQKTTIVQRFLISVSIVWLLLMIDDSLVRYDNLDFTFDFGDYAKEGLIPVVIVWGLYWIINGIKEWYYKK